MSNCFASPSRKVKLANTLLISLTLSSVSSYVLYRLFRKGASTAQKRGFMSRAQLSSVFLQRMRKIFQNNRKTSLNALRVHLDKCDEKIKSILDVERDVANLKSPQSGQGNRAQYWQKIKVDSFLRVISGVCALGMMHMFLSVQINMVSRYLFLKHIATEKEKWREQKVRFEQEEEQNASWWSKLTNKIMSFSTDDDSADDEEVVELSPEVQQEFMSFIAHFPEHGLEKLVSIIEPHARNHLEPLSLKQAFEHQDLNDIINKIRADAFPHILNSLQEMILPPEADDEGRDPQVRCLLDEMRDILDSPPFSSMLKVSFDCCFNVLYQHIEKVFRQSEKTSTSPGVKNGAQSLHLAKIIPHVTNEVKSLFDSNLENEYLSRMYDDETLIRFMASVYGAGFKDF